MGHEQNEDQRADGRSDGTGHENLPKNTWWIDDGPGGQGEYRLVMVAQALRSEPIRAHSMRAAGATLLSVDAGKTLMIDGDAILRAANDAGIVVVGRASAGGAV